MSTNNPGIYNAAVGGAMSGAMDAMLLANTQSSSYANLVNFCVTYATAIDAAIPAISGGASSSQISLMSQLSRSAWSKRCPTASTSGFSSTTIAAIVAAWTAGCARFAAEAAVVANSIHARGVCRVYADITAFHVLDALDSNDGINYVEGDVVLLFNQNFDAMGAPAFPEQNGPWVVGRVVADHAVLTRPSNWVSGTTVPTFDFEVMVGSEGLIFSNTSWHAMGPQNSDGTIVTPGKSVRIGTDDPGWYPELVTYTTPLSAGVFAFNVPVYSVGANVSVTAIGAAPATTVRFDVTSLVANGLMADGVVIVSAMTIGGTVDTDNSGIVSIAVHNQSFLVAPD
jgi:hypothetical protein